MEERASWIITAVEHTNPINVYFSIQSAMVDWTLLPRSEILIIMTAGAKRKLEFPGGRKAARRALANAGLRVEDIPIGFPGGGGLNGLLGAIGSISHVGQLAGAVVTDVAMVRAVEIDIEEVSVVIPELFLNSWPRESWSDWGGSCRSKVNPMETCFFVRKKPCLNIHIPAIGWPLPILSDYREHRWSYVYRAQGLDILGERQNSIPF